MAVKKTKSFPYFYTILALLLLIGVCCVAYGLSLLKSWMADYEASRPKYVAENVFNAYFANPDVEALLDKQGYTVSPAETKEDVIRYVKEQIGGGDITYSEVTSSISGDMLKYVVSAGDNKFAQFTVLDSGEKTSYGNTIYVMGDYEIYYMVNTTSVTVVAPSDATVKVNGYTLDQSHVIATEETESCNHMPSKVLRNDNPAQGIKYATYKLTGLLYETDDVTVTDKYGASCPTVKNENGVFVSDVNYNTALKEEYAEDVIWFVEEYAKYVQASGDFLRFHKKMDASSDLYTKVRTLEYWFTHANNGYEFTDQEAFDFYEYADGVFSCRVKVTWHAWRNYAKDYYDYIDITLYLHQVDGEYLIYEMQTHSGLEMPEEEQ